MPAFYRCGRSFTKRIREPFDGALAPSDEHDVEPALTLDPVRRQVVSGGGDKAAALGAGDAAGGAAEILGAAGLHLDENQHRAVAGDEVDLPEAATVVALQDAQSFAL